MADEMTLRRRELTQTPLREGPFLVATVEYDRHRQGYYLNVSKHEKISGSVKPIPFEGSYRSVKLEESTSFSRERLGHLAAVVTEREEYKRLMAEFLPLEPLLL
jgi:hypothetical protein